jgi:hypothetical protein
MAYIVTFPLNREQDGYEIISSLDELPRLIATQFTDDYCDLDTEVTDFSIHNIFEIGPSVMTKELMKKAYAAAKVQVDKFYKDEEEEKAKYAREYELRELARLKSIYEKQ